MKPINLTFPNVAVYNNSSRNRVEIRIHKPRESATYISNFFFVMLRVATNLVKTHFCSHFFQTIGTRMRPTIKEAIIGQKSQFFSLSQHQNILN